MHFESFIDIAQIKGFVCQEFIISRYSSKENTVTNNTLQLITRIYNYSNAIASKLLSDIIDESIEIGIEINQQKKANGSVLMV